MIVKTVLPSPTLDQIEELRSAFFAKLEKEGAPCSGNSGYVIQFQANQNNNNH